MTVTAKLDAFVLMMRQNSTALGRTLIVFFYYVFGVIYYQKTEGWNKTDCIYFITGKFDTILPTVLKSFESHFSLKSKIFN